MAKPFIAAFHAGSTSVNKFIEKEQLIYWYRPNLRSLSCDSTDTTMVKANNESGNYFKGRPDGWQSMADSVFVVALLKEAGTVTIMSGSNAQTFNAPAGASSFAVDMQLGKQQFFLTRNGQTVLSAVSLNDVIDVCPCGNYNFNAYVGTVPESAPDQLGADGLASLASGLHVSTCSARLTLGTSPIKPIIIPNGGGGNAIPTPTVVSPTTLASITSQRQQAVSPAPKPTTTTAASSTQSPKFPGQVSRSSTTTILSSTPTKISGCTRTITALSQLFPTNCLQKLGDVWAGPAGQQRPEMCDGPARCGIF